MAIWTDSDFIDSQDMNGLDSEVSSVADSESPPIVLDAISGQSAPSLCQSAIDECGRFVMNQGQAFSGFMPPFMAPYNQTAAVIQMVGPSVNRTRYSLSQIVVSAPLTAYMSDLKCWVVYCALYQFYRTAFYRRMNDRYERKMDMFASEIKLKYWPRVWNTGMPISNTPLVCPGAVHEFNAGTFGPSNVSSVAGVNLNALAQYDVAITWVDQSKYVSPTNNGNAESGPSAAMTIEVPSSQAIQVGIAGLNPPNGTSPVNVSLGLGVITPGNATGWNVYVGVTDSVPYFMWLQNSVPIPIKTLTYTLSGPPVLQGNSLMPGQLPDSYQTLQSLIMRG
jgi:hypothetical protein